MSRALPADLDCIVAVEQVTDYLEGALSLHARTEFEQHRIGWHEGKQKDQRRYG